jgi:hypothetical protein
MTRDDSEHNVQIAVASIRELTYNKKSDVAGQSKRHLLPGGNHSRLDFSTKRNSLQDKAGQVY